MEKKRRFTTTINPLVKSESHCLNWKDWLEILFLYFWRKTVQCSAPVTHSFDWISHFLCKTAFFIYSFVLLLLSCCWCYWCWFYLWPKARLSHFSFKSLLFVSLAEPSINQVCSYINGRMFSKKIHNFLSVYKFSIERRSWNQFLFSNDALSHLKRSNTNDIALKLDV